MVHKCTLPITEKKLGGSIGGTRAIGAKFLMPMERDLPFR